MNESAESWSSQVVFLAFFSVQVQFSMSSRVCSTERSQQRTHTATVRPERVTLRSDCELNSSQIYLKTSSFYWYKILPHFKLQLWQLSSFVMFHVSVHIMKFITLFSILQHNFNSVIRSRISAAERERRLKFNDQEDLLYVWVTRTHESILQSDMQPINRAELISEKHQLLQLFASHGIKIWRLRYQTFKLTTHPFSLFVECVATENPTNIKLHVTWTPHLHQDTYRNHNQVSCWWPNHMTSSCQVILNGSFCKSWLNKSIGSCFVVKTGTLDWKMFQITAHCELFKHRKLHVIINAAAPTW